MKKQAVVAALAALAASAFSGSAMAADLANGERPTTNVYFHGRIVKNACEFTSTSQNQLIELDTYPQEYFKRAELDAIFPGPDGEAPEAYAW